MPRMGMTTQKLVVKERRSARRKAQVRMLIDSGAVYSLVPAKTLAQLGIRPYRKVEFALADGRTISRKVGDAYFEHEGAGGAAPVIFGEEGDEPLLGATTLESLGLVLDPFKRRLVPMRMLLSTSWSASRICGYTCMSGTSATPINSTATRTSTKVKPSSALMARSSVRGLWLRPPRPWRFCRPRRS